MQYDPSLQFPASARRCDKQIINILISRPVSGIWVSTFNCNVVGKSNIAYYLSGIADIGTSLELSPLRNVSYRAGQKS